MKHNPKHDAEFLRQLPEWESAYKKSDKMAIHYTPVQWKTAKAKFAAHDLRILDEPVMEDWEEPYMKVLAEIATMNGGTILEVGYGMGISARFIQQQRINEHIIIEANHDVAIAARAWANSCQIKTVVLEGLWQEVIGQVEDASLGGILFDTYPLTEKELYQNHFNFFPFAFGKLKTDGVFTYYSDETKWFSKIHLLRLNEAGFKEDRIDGNPVQVNPPKDCEYWKANTILAPIIRK